MLAIVLFTAFCAFELYMIFINLFFGKQATLEKWRTIENQGQLKYLSNKLMPHIFELGPLFFASSHVKFSNFWLFLLIMRIIVITAGIIVFSSANASKAPPLTDALLASNIKQGRLRGSFHIGVLFIWIYAWQDSMF